MGVSLSVAAIVQDLKDREIELNILAAHAVCTQRKAVRQELLNSMKSKMNEFKGGIHLKQVVTGPEFRPILILN